MEIYTAFKLHSVEKVSILLRKANLVNLIEKIQLRAQFILKGQKN